MNPIADEIKRAREQPAETNGETYYERSLTPRAARFWAVTLKKTRHVVDSEFRRRSLVHYRALDDALAIVVFNEWADDRRPRLDVTLVPWGIARENLAEKGLGFEEELVRVGVALADVPA